MPDAKQTRLLFVITLSAWGGAQTYVLRAAKEAIRRGFEVRIAAGGNGELKKRCFLEIPNRYHELAWMKRSISPFVDFFAEWELKKLMNEWKPDIVYLHSSKAGVLGSRAARNAGVKRVIYRIGGWSFLDPVSPLERSLRLWSERRTAKLKDAIIVLHPEDEALAKQYNITPREEVAIIPNGIDTQRFDWDHVDVKLARQRLQGLWARGRAAGSKGFTYSPGKDNPPLVLTVANFYPAKNLLGYLDAIVVAHKKIPDARFLVLGDGPERKAIEAKRKRLGLENVISLPDALRDASTLLRGADAFVLPSAKEGMPWALLEAMAAGLPCIATNVGACAWMLGENGWVVPAGDADRLAMAITDALRDSQRARAKGTAARRDVEWRFTAERMWEETFRVLTP